MLAQRWTSMTDIGPALNLDCWDVFARVIF